VTATKLTNHTPNKSRQNLWRLDWLDRPSKIQASKFVAVKCKRALEAQIGLQISRKWRWAINENLWLLQKVGKSSPTLWASIFVWPKSGQWQLRALRGFSGHRAWVRIIKKWAPGSYCLELVVKLVQLPGQVLSFSDASESIRKNLIPCELNNWFIQFLSNSPGNSKCLLKCALVRGIGNVTLRNFVNWNFEPVHINDLIQYLILVLSRKLSFTGDLVTYLWINLKLIQLRWKKKRKENLLHAWNKNEAQSSAFINLQR
jgi:hypothetical protein